MRLAAALPGRTPRDVTPPYFQNEPTSSSPSLTVTMLADHLRLDPAPVAQRPDVRITGDGPPVVLLHSSMGSKSQWASLTERLQGRRRVVAIDLLGYGQAPAAVRGPEGFALADEARRVEAIVDGLLGAGAPLLETA